MTNCCSPRARMVPKMPELSSTREPGSSESSILRCCSARFFCGTTIMKYIRPMKTAMMSRISM